MSSSPTANAIPITPMTRSLAVAAGGESLPVPGACPLSSCAVLVSVPVVMPQDYPCNDGYDKPMTEQGTNPAPPETGGIDGDILGTLHRMAHQVDEMHKVFAGLRPLLEGYQRGGVLGARTAARRIGKQGGS